jgi:hypothetical protein
MGPSPRTGRYMDAGAAESFHIFLDLSASESSTRLEWSQTNGHEPPERRRSETAEQNGAQTDVDRGRTKETN